MTRKRKPILIATRTERQTGNVYEIYYNPNEDRHVHQVTIGDWFKEDPDLEVVGRAAEEHIRAAMNYSWQAVIEATARGAIPTSSMERVTAKGIYLGIERYYVAILPNGMIRKAGWDVQPEHRIREAQNFYWKGTRDIKEEFRVPLTVRKDYTGGHATYLAYSEELWRGLRKIQDTIDLLAGRLTTLLETEPGRALLAEQADTLLIAGPQETS